MKFKKTPLFLPILLSLSLIFSSCNSVKTAGESSELTVDNSSVSSIKETENSNLSNSSVVSKVETESEILSTQSSEAPETNQQTPSSSAQQPEDLTSEGIERADRLMNELKNTGIEIIRFYSTKGTNLAGTGFQKFSERAKNQQPVNVIDGRNNIQKFLESLKLKEWIPKRFNVRSLPKAIIYLSENLHINLETQQGGFSWMSINLAEYANVYFVVPNDVYDSVLGYIEYEQTPANAIGYYTELTAQEKQVAEKLINIVNNAEADKLRLYDATTFGVGFLPLEKAERGQEGKIIDNKSEIENFTKELGLEKWQARRVNLNTYPTVAIYLSENLHINLETQQDGICWVSINSAEYMNVYFVVPENTYQNILKCYG